ncbi:Gamma-glutamylcyclotransferase, AIG2-like domain [Dillenia turbinata]|uniref:Gamma-glutamylcyclotransferase family protein n=1 Tax=Dillenia turbinata TaxID=194707 RepID=A0AAN8W747_9MAGN
MSEQTASPQTLIFTYGTLKRNFPNHSLIESLISAKRCRFISNCTTLNALPLIIGPYSIPYLLNFPNAGGCHRVSGELYSVSDVGLLRLDELEGISCGHYERLPIKVVVCGEVVEAMAYYGGKGFAEEMWKKKGSEVIKEYRETDANEYVWRENRPWDLSFLDAIEVFLKDGPFLVFLPTFEIFLPLPDKNCCLKNYARTRPCSIQFGNPRCNWERIDENVETILEHPRGTFLAGDSKSNTNDKYVGGMTVYMSPERKISGVDIGWARTGSGVARDNVTEVSEFCREGVVHAAPKLIPLDKPTDVRVDCANKFYMPSLATKSKVLLPTATLLMV